MKILFNDLTNMKNFISSQVGTIDDETFKSYLEIIKCDISFDEPKDGYKAGKNYEYGHAFPLGIYDYAFSSIRTPVIDGEERTILVSINTDKKTYICATWEES